MTVQTLIDLLMLMDKGKPVTVRLNQAVPGYKYSAGDRLSIAYVENSTKEGFPCIDLCCQPFACAVKEDPKALEEAKKDPFRLEYWSELFEKYGVTDRNDQQRYLDIVEHNDNLLIDKATFGLYWRGTSEVHGFRWWLEQAIQHKITKESNYIKSTQTSKS